AGPALNFLLGRQPGLSLLQACTPPGDDGPNEALFATVLRAWLLASFRSPVGDLTLATEDVEFLVAHLPGSNDILASVAGSPAQAPAVRGLTAEAALHWATTATGDRRIPYRLAGPDALLRHLVDLPAADEALLWHLLVNDDATAPDRMPWSDYASLMARLRERLDALNLPAGSRVRAYLDLAAELQPSVAGVFAENEIDLRRVLARLAEPPPEP